MRSNAFFDEKNLVFRNLKAKENYTMSVCVLFIRFHAKTAKTVLLNLVHFFPEFLQPLFPKNNGDGLASNTQPKT